MLSFGSSADPYAAVATKQLMSSVSMQIACACASASIAWSIVIAHSWCSIVLVMPLAKVGPATSSAAQRCASASSKRWFCTASNTAACQPRVCSISAIGNSSPSMVPCWIAVIVSPQAMGTAALRTPGAKKTEIQQLVRVDWDKMPVFGVPKIFSAITRSADMNKTPDVRTRAILPEWACVLTVRFQVPILNEQAIANLLAAAGRISGVGDWRQEKGSGSFGAFTLVDAKHPDFVRICKTGGRVQQEAALANPEPYDDETSELISWFMAESQKRGHKATGADSDDETEVETVEPKSSPVRKPRTNGSGAHVQ